MRFLIRDRDAKLCRSFDDVFNSAGAELLLTPVQAPNANVYAERWIRTVRAECLDWLLIVSRRHLAQVLRVYVAHYNAHRPHRALGLEPPDPSANPTVISGDRHRVHRRDRLGGLLHEYHRQAASTSSCTLRDHGRLKARLRPMRALQQDHSARVVIAGHDFVQKIRRAHYERRSRRR
jgi:hypothetical protein